MVGIEIQQILTSLKLKQIKVQLSKNLSVATSYDRIFQAIHSHCHKIHIRMGSTHQSL